MPTHQATPADSFSPFFACYLQHRQELFEYVASHAGSWPDAEAVFDKITRVLHRNRHRCPLGERYLPWAKAVARKVIRRAAL